MSPPLPTKAVLNGIAVCAIVYGFGVLLLKVSVILPALNWLRSLTPAELDTYLSTFARASIATGALILLAMVVMTRQLRNNPQQGDQVDENTQRLRALDDTQQQPARPVRPRSDSPATPSPPQPRS